MSFVTILVAKGNLICIPLRIGVIAHPGAVVGQKGIIKICNVPRLAPDRSPADQQA
jgi:hypothetical protein